MCAVFSPIRASKGRHGLSELGSDMVNAVTGPDHDSVLLIFSNPHIVAEVRAPSRVVWAYGEDRSSQRAALEFLRGTRFGPHPESYGRTAKIDRASGLRWSSFGERGQRRAACPYRCRNKREHLARVLRISG